MRANEIVALFFSRGNVPAGMSTDSWKECTCTFYFNQALIVGRIVVGHSRWIVRGMPLKRRGRRFRTMAVAAGGMEMKRETKEKVCTDVQRRKLYNNIMLRRTMSVR